MKANAIILAATLGFLTAIPPAFGDFAFVPGQGRVTQIVTESSQRQVLAGWNLPTSGLVAVDPTSGDFYTADQDDQSVYRINHTNGLVTMVSGPGIGTGPALSTHVYGIAVETNGNPVVVDAVGGLLGVMRVDARTGNRSVLSAGSNSANPVGTGANFQSPFGIAIETSGNILVTDTSRNAIIRVDRITGNRTVASGDPFGDNIGSGPDLPGPQGIAVNSKGLIYVTTAGQVFSIDAITGNRTNIFTVSARFGGDGVLYSVAIATNGMLVLPFQITINYYPTGGGILSIDPVTTAAIFISSTGDGLINFPVGAGTNFLSPIGITIGKDGTLITSDVLTRSLFVVDPITGNRNILANSRKGGGIDLYVPKGVAIGTNGIMVVADDGDNTTYDYGFNTYNNRWPLVLQIDPATGNRSVLSAGSNTGVPRGSGSNFDEPQGVAREASGSFIVADDGSTNPKLVRIDPASGNRTIVSSSSVGTGTNLSGPYGVALESSGTIIVTDINSRLLLRVDPVTGNRTVVSGSTFGGGTPFSYPRGVAVLHDGMIAVADAAINVGGIFLVNPTTGNRTMITSSTIGSGPAIYSANGIAETAQGDLLVVDNTTETVFKVNRTTGNRTIVSSTAIGSGPCVENAPEFIAAVPSLKLSSFQRQTNGSVHFNLTSPLGRQCAVDVSTNLSTWTQITNFATTSATNIVSDTNAPYKMRFYRARLVL